MTSYSILIEHRKKLASLHGTCEVDVWPEIQNLTRDVISRAALGSSFEEGRDIFELQREHITLTLEALQTLYIPGFMVRLQSIYTSHRTLVLLFEWLKYPFKKFDPSFFSLLIVV